MTPASKMDFKKIKDAINSLSRDDQRTRLTTKVGDNPANVENVLTLIEDLCAVIRQQEELAVTRKQIAALQSEADAANDDAMVDICESAIDGDPIALRAVADAISQAAAMACS